MEDSYDKLFKRTKPEDPQSQLLNTIIISIEKKDSRRREIQIAVFGILSVVALGALIPAWNELTTEVARSGFFQFVSLLFSDSATLMTYWKEFVFSLLESLPTFGLVITVGAIFAFLASLRLFIKNLAEEAKLRASLIRVKYGH